MAVMFSKLGGILKRTLAEWSKDDAPRMGASLAFYAVLSLAPLVITAISLSGFVFGNGTVERTVTDQFRRLMGDEGAAVVQSVLRNRQKSSGDILAMIVGILLLLFGASGVFVELRAALNRLWEVEEPPSGGLLRYVRDRFLSFGMVLAIGFLLLVSLIISAALAFAGSFLGGLGIFPAWIWELINFAVSFAGVTGLFALIFRYVADIRIPWPAAWRGAIVTSLLFTIGKTAIGLYLGKAGVGSAYGAGGSLVVLLVWVYYSAQLFFLGAEFTRVVTSEPGDGNRQAGAQRG